MVTSVETKKELDRDVKVFKEILYEAVEKSIIFQKQAKEEMKTQQGRYRVALETLVKVANVRNIVFFNPKQYIEQCFDRNKTLSLAEVRKARATITQLAINTERVIVKLSSRSALTVSHQLEIISHITDGLGPVAQKQFSEIHELRKVLAHSRVKVPLAEMVNGLSKGRIICMFYIKWLTIVDNEYTDSEIAKAGTEVQRDFGNRWEKTLGTIAEAPGSATIDRIESRFQKFERILKKHARESKFDHNLMKTQIEELRILYTSLVEEYLDEAKSYVKSQTSELRKLLLEIEIELRNKDQSKMGEARSLRSRLEKGLGVSADIVQLVTFFTGIASVPALIGSPLANQAVQFIQQLLQKLRRT